MNDDNPETNPSKTTLSDYVSFEVEELIEGDLITKLYQYTISYNYNISGTTGEITITNKNPNPTKVDVFVEKVWSDGNDKHSGDSITVKLYKSDTAISDADLANIKIPDSRLEVVTGEGITNTVTLNDSNNWKHTWNDLPFKGEGVSKYYYYAIETSVPKGYTASYFVNGNKTTIMNSVPGSLTIDKKWLSKDGKDITSEIENEVSFKLYRRANSSAAADEDKKLNNLKIYAFGDSITAGEGLDNPTNERYSALLQQKLSANGTNITVENKSQSGAKIAITDVDEWNTIEGFIKNNLNNDYGVVIVMAGTNNVLNTKDTIDEMKNKMSGLLDMVYSKDKNSNLVVFLEKIPKIIDFENDGNVHPGNRFDGDNLQESEYQGKWNELVTKYNEMLVQLASEYSGTNKKPIIVVDTYTAVGENFYRDSYAKIHPDKVGHEAIAELLYNEILSYYGIKGSKAPTDIKGLPSDFYKNGSVNPLYEEVTGKAFTLSSEKGWSKTIKDLDKKDTNGNDYVYYIVEESTGNWTAAYTGNGQIIGNEGATITVTNTIDKGSIDVEKVWKNANGSDYTPSDMQSIEVQLYRSTTPPTDSELRTSSIMNEPMALAVNDLPSYLEKEPNNSEERYILTIDESGVSGNNQLKYKIPANTECYAWIKLKVSDSMKDKKVSKIEFPNGLNWCTIEGYNGSTITISPPKTLQELLDVSDPGFSGNITEDSYLIITLAEESEGGDTGGGGTGGGNTGESTPTEPQEVTSLTLETVPVTNPDGTPSTNKKAVISDTSIKAGDVITVTLRGIANEIINGCIGCSVTDEPYWYQENWGDITIDADGTKTLTFTVPLTYSPNTDIQVQIWYNNASVDSATYTVTSGGTTTDPEPNPPTEPDAPDPEPTDSHIPTGAELLETITLKSANDWKHTFDNRPLTDASGYPYYYYVKEVNVPEGFEVTYSDGVTPDGKITITNTKKESSTTTMPSTGGKGARKYYTVGGMLLLMSACGWAMHRRKRVIPH